MQTVIGLGQAGCNIAEYLKRYPEYECFKFDSGLKRTKSTYGIKEQFSSEAYEAKFPKLRSFLKTPRPETLFITSCGKVTGAALKILQHIKDSTSVTLMYIIPDPSSLNSVQKKQNNLFFNVFQEYARSGLFEKVILVDNKKVSAIVGPAPMLKYWELVNEAIASTYHMINVFSHSKPVFTTLSDRIETARITTQGLITSEESEESEEKCFFSLDIPREKRYYYAIPQKMLEEDDMLMTKIQKQVKNGIEHDKMKVGFSVYETSYESPIVYCESYSTLIQKKSAF